MAAQTKERAPTRYGNKLTLLNLPVATSTKIWAGSLVGKNAAGYAVPMSAGTTTIAMGLASATVDNLTGANGDKRIDLEKGAYNFVNSGTDPVTIADLGKLVYAEDDQTIAKTDATATLDAVGYLIHFENGVPFVDIGDRHTGDS